MVTTQKTMLLVLIFLSLTSWTTSAQEKNGLVAHWSFDEEQGEVVKDSSGNGYNGKIVKAKRVKGIKGNAIEFNGNDSYVECFTGDSNLSIVDGITIEAWVKISPGDLNSALGLPDEISDTHHMIVSKIGGATWYLSISRKSVFFSPWLNGKQTYLAGKKTISANEWYHIACSWDAGTGEYRTYLDGQIDVNMVYKGVLGKSKQNLLIGAYAKKGGFFLKGIIDEIAIYNRALTTQEIATNYKKYAH